MRAAMHATHAEAVMPAKGHVLLIERPDVVRRLEHLQRGSAWNLRHSRAPPALNNHAMPRIAAAFDALAATNSAIGPSDV